MIGLRKASGYSAGFQVSLFFFITQHVRDELLMNSLIEYLGCGIIYRKNNKEVLEYRATKVSDISEKILPFFQKYPIIGVKSKDFQDFCRVVKLMEVRAHLTQEGVDEIRSIKTGMNTGRS